MSNSRETRKVTKWKCLLKSHSCTLLSSFHLLLWLPTHEVVIGEGNSSLNPHKASTPWIITSDLSTSSASSRWAPSCHRLHQSSSPSIECCWLGWMHFQFELFPLSEHSSPLGDHFASLAFPSVVASRTHHHHHHSILHLKEVIIMIAEKKKRLGIGSPEAKSANGSSAARRGHWGGATHPPCRGHHHHHHHHHH